MERLTWICLSLSLSALACPKKATAPCTLDAECGFDQVCLQGECFPWACGDRPCHKGQGCVNGACVDADCKAVKCPSGQTCANGSCYPSDCPSASCNPDEICWQGEACRTTLCEGVTCADDESCADGLCYPTNCVGVVCAQGAVCDDGRCVDARCIGVVCASGEVCSDGRCMSAQCSGVACPAGEGCVGGQCVDVRCVGLSCAAGASCVAGACVSSGAPDAGIAADASGSDAATPADAGAPPDAGSGADASGPDAGPAGCQIASSFVPAFQFDPSSYCRYCEPSLNAAGWTTSPDGTSCGAGQQCSQGTCGPGTCGAFEWAYWPPSAGTVTATADTATDNGTGLVWQLQPPAASRTWDEARAYCGNLDLGGFSSGWRLPALVELFNPPAANFAGPGGAYWTSTPVSLSAGNTWAVDWSFGEPSWQPAVGSRAFARCVYGGTSPTGPHYTAAATTVKDNWTGMVWQRAEGQMGEWPSDNDYCQTLNQGGFATGWRMPSLSEALTLFDPCSAASPAVDPLFSGSTSVWTASFDPLSMSGAMFFLNYSDGTAGSIEVDDRLDVRCVH